MKAPGADESWHGNGFSMVFASVAFVFSLMAPSAGLAEESKANKNEFVHSIVLTTTSLTSRCTAPLIPQSGKI